MYSDQFSHHNIGQTYQNSHFNMYYPTHGYYTNYSGNMHYNVYSSHLPCDNTVINNSSLDRIRTREEDEKAIEHFLQENETVIVQNKQKKPFKIAAAKNTLISVTKLNKQLQTVCAELKSNIDLPETQWQEKLNACNTAKHEISEILKNIKDTDFLNKVKTDLEKRKRKRLREQHSREKWKKEKLLKAEKKARLHAEIDLWIRKQQAIIEKEKQEENLRKDADMILSDVRNKRNDARKYLGILQELQNLRKIKINIARARGEHLSSAADEAFNNIIAKLIDQWTTLDQEYSIEEQGLKLMLKTDNDKRIEKQTKNLFDDWENVLFGKSIIATEQTHKDLSNFITLRTTWDKFITSKSDATTIPIGWIVPEKPSSAAWQKYLKKETS